MVVKPKIVSREESTFGETYNLDANAISNKGKFSKRSSSASKSSSASSRRAAASLPAASRSSRSNKSISELTSQSSYVEPHPFAPWYISNKKIVRVKGNNILNLSKKKKPKHYNNNTNSITL